MGGHGITFCKGCFYHCRKLLPMWSRCSVGSECVAYVEHRARCLEHTRSCPPPSSSEAGESESSVLACTARRCGDQSLGECPPLCDPRHCWFLLPWSLVSIVSCSVAKVVQLTPQKGPEPNSVPLPVPISDCPWLWHLFSEAPVWFYFFPPSPCISTDHSPCSNSLT